MLAQTVAHTDGQTRRILKCKMRHIVIFIKDEQLICVDSQHLQGAFTYIRDDGQCRSWIDHFVCSPPLLNCTNDVSVMYDKVSSD